MIYSSPYLFPLPLRERIVSLRWPFATLAKLGEGSLLPPKPDRAAVPVQRAPHIRQPHDKPDEEHQQHHTRRGPQKVIHHPAEKGAHQHRSREIEPDLARLRRLALVLGVFGDFRLNFHALLNPPDFLREIGQPVPVFPPLPPPFDKHFKPQSCEIETRMNPQNLPQPKIAQKPSQEGSPFVPDNKR